MATEIQMLKWRLDQTADRAERAERQRDMLLEALEGLLENHKHNDCQGLGLGPLLKAKQVISAVREAQE